MYVREAPQGKPAFLGILASACLYLHQDMRWFGEEMGSVVNNQKKKSVSTAKIQSSILHA